MIDDMLFSHGTVTNKFLQKYPETLSSKELVDAINEEYSESIIRQKRTERIKVLGPNYRIPDWSRRGTNPGEHSDKDAMTRLGTICAFSGHIRSDSIYQVNHEGVWGNVSQTFGDILPYTQYLVDVGPISKSTGKS